MHLVSRWRDAMVRQRHRAILLFAFPLIAAGCATYKSEPLSREAFIQHLAQRSAQDGRSPEGESAPITVGLAEAKRIALLYNPTLRAARLRANVPVISAKEAGVLDDPELSFDISRLVHFAENPWTVGSSLAMTLPLSGRLSLEKKMATAEGHAALVEAWTIEQEHLHELELAWIEALAARRAADVSSEALKQVEEVVAITNRLEGVGELITAEGVVFRVAQSRARLDARRDASRVLDIDAQIVAMLGLMPDAPITLAIEATQLPDATTPSRDVLLARHPAVLLREAEYEVAEQSLRLEVRKQYPDLTLAPSFEREGNQQDTLGLGVSFPLPILNANRRAIAEARAHRDAARGAWEEAAQTAISALAQMEARLKRVDSRRQEFDGGVLALSESQLREARRLADQGEVNALLLLEALQTRQEIAHEGIELDAERDRLLAEIRALAPADTINPTTDSNAKGVAK